MFVMFIENPVLKGFNPDPSICRAGDDYYIATSTFEWFPGVQIHHSKDLVNWHLITHPLNKSCYLDMKGNPDSGGIWAPDLSYADGKFWLIYTDVKVVDGMWKDCHNYLTTCDTIDGEWSKPVPLNGSGFDASLFHDANGKKYLVNMYWDQRVYHHNFYGIALQEYSTELKKLIGKASIIYKGTDIKYTEGPHLYRIDGMYYLLTAEGGTTYQHSETVARCKTLMGEYEIQPDYPLLTAWQAPHNELQKCGHASLVQTQTGEWYMAHLTGRPLPIGNQPILEREQRCYCPLGRETAIQKIEWIDGWPKVVGGKQGSVKVAAPQLQQKKWEPTCPIKDDFTEQKLNLNFQSLRIPLTEDIASLEARKGYLRLYGKESLLSKFTQAFVARRWQAFSFDAATAVEFYPESFQQMAGLTCYYNTENWSSVHVTWKENKGRVIDIAAADNSVFSMPLEDAEISIPENVKNVHFKVSVRVDHYQYFYSFDGKTYHKIPVVFKSYQLSDDYIRGGGFFTGAFVGMNCIDITGDNKAADFDYFSYEEVEK
jgi:xylan 1,4-beta-xylosidase